MSLLFYVGKRRQAVIAVFAGAKVRLFFQCANIFLFFSHGTPDCIRHNGRKHYADRQAVE